MVHSIKSANNVLKETFSHLASQAGKAIFSPRKQSRPVVGKLSPTIAFKVFDCQILPILEYGSDIWYTGDDVNDLEKIHLKFIKSTLGVRKQTPTPAIYGDTGRFPLIIRQHIKAVKYWCRILKLSQSHPVRKAYNMLLELDGIASRIGVPVFALSSNDPGLIKFGNHRILGIQINLCFYLNNQLFEYLHSSGEKILRVRVSCAHMH